MTTFDNYIDKIIKSECLKTMRKFPDRVIDMVLCDLPYGSTNNKWDIIIPLKPLFEQYDRLIKDNGAIVLTARQPFTTDLINAYREHFRYEWIWVKNRATDFANAKKVPMKKHENILVFYKNPPSYNNVKAYSNKQTKKRNTETVWEGLLDKGEWAKGTYITEDSGYSDTVLYFESEVGLHPTQKPVSLFEFLIETYTQENDIVLDNTAGSGTTGVACINTDRRFVLIEKEAKYVKIISNRLKKARQVRKSITSRKLW